ncbi:hypothetical protein [Leifsonia xyli]|uniref:hypothetical protein n=1 Tax=Leifsonia xyli TaxID=1575 RepID=UPI003D67F32A
MTTTQIELTDAQKKRVKQRSRREVARLGFFAENVNARRAPQRLTSPHTRQEFAALSVEERTAVLEVNLRAQVLAAVLAAEPKPDDAPRPTAAPRTPTRATYLVSCGDGCGTFLPARSHRPVLAYAEGHRPAQRRPKRLDD